MFQITFHETENGTYIHIDGTSNLLDKLEDIFDLTKTKALREKSDVAESRVKISVLKLRGFFLGVSIPQILLNFIENYELLIEKRSEFLLKFWDFELNMISQRKSYRSGFPRISQLLTSAEVVNYILDQLLEIPSPNELFRFLETSDAHEENPFSCDPPAPHPYEIEEFVEEQKQQKNLKELKEYSKLIATESKKPGSYFSKLPKELNLKIAFFTGNPQAHDAKSTTEIIEPYFTSCK
jgi:hypothetical protein